MSPENLCRGSVLESIVEYVGLEPIQQVETNSRRIVAVHFAQGSVTDGVSLFPPSMLVEEQEGIQLDTYCKVASSETQSSSSQMNTTLEPCTTSPDFKDRVSRELARCLMLAWGLTVPPVEDKRIATYQVPPTTESGVLSGLPVSLEDHIRSQMMMWRPSTFP